MTSGDLDLWDTVIRKNMCTPGYVLDVCAKNEADRTNGLWGVSDCTHRQTYDSIDNIDLTKKFSHRRRLGLGWLRCWFTLIGVVPLTPLTQAPSEMKSALVGRMQNMPVFCKDYSFKMWASSEKAISVDGRKSWFEW